MSDRPLFCLVLTHGIEKVRIPTDAAIGIIVNYSAYELDVPYLQLYFVPYSLPNVLLQGEQQLAFVLVVCIVARDEDVKPRHD